MSPSSATQQASVHLASVRSADDVHDDLRRMDLVDDAVVSDPVVARLPSMDGPSMPMRVGSRRVERALGSTKRAWSRRRLTEPDETSPTR